MDEIERIEDLFHEPGARIGWGAHAQSSAFRLLYNVLWERPVGQVAREALGALEAVVGGIGLAGIGVYNLTLDQDELSSNDIFWRNFVAGQAVAAAMGIALDAGERHHGRAAGSKRDTREHDWNLDVFPVRDGLGVSYTCRY